MANVTIKQIAKMAGVSISAVSIVLNGKKGVSEQTRRRILQVIKEMNYTPNVNSRRLILQRSFNIMVVLDEDMSPLANNFYTSVLNALVKRGSDLGYHIVLILNAETFEGSPLSSALSQRNVDGMIFFRDISPELQIPIQKADIPFVVVDSQENEPPYPCIRGDYELSAYAATNYLIGLGHKRIALIGMKRIPNYFMHSFSGYKAAMEEAKLPVQMDWIQSGAHDEHSAGACMAKILQSAELPTAIYCTGDAFAIGVMNHLQDRGYRIPEDFSVMGIDDIAIASCYRPSLTTIRIDMEHMGRMAVELLDQLINHVEVDTNQTVASDRIIERCSVRPLPKEPHAGKLK